MDATLDALRDGGPAADWTHDGVAYHEVETMLSIGSEPSGLAVIETEIRAGRLGLWALREYSKVVEIPTAERRRFVMRAPESHDSIALARAVMLVRQFNGSLRSQYGDPSKLLVRAVEVRNLLARASGTPAGVTAMDCASDGLARAVAALAAELAAKTEVKRRMGEAMLRWAWSRSRCPIGRSDWPAIVSEFDRLGGTYTVDEASNVIFAYGNESATSKRAASIKSKVDAVLARFAPPSWKSSPAA